MDSIRAFLLTILLIVLTSKTLGCVIEGVPNWWVDLNVVDTDRGVFFQGTTTDITGIQNAEHSGDDLNFGPYFTATHENSQFILTLNENFANYEEYETSQYMSISITFGCSTGVTRNIVFIVSIIDTNNNAPTFTPTTDFTFTVTPPLPPGYQVTGCISDIIVKDIDLTTQRIDFSVLNNDLFEIYYDSGAVAEAKNFGAVLRTTTFIRSLSEPVVLNISATDVDQTGDPPITTFTTVRIEPDGVFQYPDEPVFSQPYYLSIYSDNHELSIQDPIYLEQGYDDEVLFQLTGDYANFFNLSSQDNLVTIRAISELPSDILNTEQQLYLIVRAEREHTSGATSTVVVQLPEGVRLEFELALYVGSIADNVLSLPQLILSQAYENGYNITFYGDHATYFSALSQGNAITVLMSQLPENIIEENNFISLEVTAQSDTSTASTAVSLEIIKNDTVTPLFERRVYEGAYDIASGLSLDDIVLSQGYDETVSFYMEGDHTNLFTLTQSGNVVRLALISELTQEIFQDNQDLLITVAASKPRTVGAHTAVSIILPAARELGFEQITYVGSLQETDLNIPTIVLTVGYDTDVTFTLIGEHASHFTLSNTQNSVSLQLVDTIPDYIILENNILTLSIEASALYAQRALSNIILEVVKQDVVTPVFSKHLYGGVYLDTVGFDIEEIVLTQGYDDSVTFRLDGEFSQYFALTSEGNSVMIALQSNIPENTIFNEKVFVFNIVADKALTVGANAAVSISFPQGLTEPTILTFSKNTYLGTYENEEFTIEDIMLTTGSAQNIEFSLTGEYASYFTLTSNNNAVTIAINNPLPIEVMENIKYLLLEVEASGERAVSTTSSLIVDIQSVNTVVPVFSDPFYRGEYTLENGLNFSEAIYLLQGYDDTVTFGLEGDYSELFSLVENGNSLNLVIASQISEEILFENRHLLFSVVANKPNTIEVTAAVVIDLPDEASRAVVRFTSNSYVGRIETGLLELEPIVVLGDYDEFDFAISGDYSPYFAINLEGDTITLELRNLAEQVLVMETLIILEIEASNPNASSDFSTVVLEIIRDTDAAAMPIFEESYYTGSYTVTGGLIVDNSIRLIQGYDDDVQFALAGDDAQWFSISQEGDTVSLTVNNENSTTLEKAYLLFSVVARKPGALDGSAAVVIALPDFSAASSLHFTEINYVGTVENGSLTLDNIQLQLDDNSNINLTLSGDLSEYFTVVNEQGSITLLLASELPNVEIENQNMVVFTLEARSVTEAAYATVILELVKVSVPPSFIYFEEAFYEGSYSETDGLVFEHEIRLADGLNDAVVFSLEGEYSQLFELEQSSGYLTLSLLNPISSEVLANRQYLLLSAVASNEDQQGKSAIVISLLDDYTSPTVLRFQRNHYIGSLEESYLDVNPIILAEGYSENVVFYLYGDLAEYFQLTSNGSTVSLLLSNQLPDDINTNNIIVLEIEASGLQTISAFATVIIEILNPDNTSTTAPSFSEVFYSGLYTEQNGLQFVSTISLAEGYEDTVVFSLEGAFGQWFSLQQNGNSLTLSVVTAIPSEVLAINHNLIFSVVARSVEGATTRAAVIIALPDDFSGALFLRFEETNYVGSILDRTIELNQIVLLEGYSENVTFTLSGENSQYFTLVSSEAVVTIDLIPDANINSDIIVLELEASATGMISAYTTIVLEVISEHSSEITEFSSFYYNGQYSEETGLTHEVITLDYQGSEDVQISLDGDYAQYFTLVHDSNSINLFLTSPLPSVILANNHNIILTITATISNGVSSRAIFVISLIDDYSSATVIRFDRINYIGIIENGSLSVPVLFVSEGYSSNVTFALHGDLANYFNLLADGPYVSLEMETSIPQEILSVNNIIVIEVEASALQSITAYSTVVLEVLTNNTHNSSEPLSFDEPYYTGYYTEESGLVFENTIVLTQGYDNNVVFSLEGTYSQWFSLLQAENSVRLELANNLPSEILANNQQIILVLLAESPTSATRATLVISLTDDYTSATLLRFERNHYIGSIIHTTLTLSEIVLTEGYSDNVTFLLLGDMASYFILNNEGPTLTLEMSNTISEEILSSNEVIVIEIEAFAQQTISAYATVILEVRSENDNDTVLPSLTFSEIYYIGSYTEADGLSLNEDIIYITEDYETDVIFSIEGEYAQWFSVSATGSLVSLTLMNPVPSEILANNHQIVLVITAEKLSVQAKATIVISLLDDYSAATALRFNEISYRGTLTNGEVSLNTILLSEGFSNDVTFTLRGELQEYFGYQNTGATITIVIINEIPTDVLQQNPLILLEIIASAPLTYSAYATIILEQPSNNGTAVVVPVFSEPYYVGRYNENGLIMLSNITIIEGYDETVTFDLEGDESTWFSIEQNENRITLMVREDFTPGNDSLIFTLWARKPGVSDVAVGIFVLISSDISTSDGISFDRALYTGSVAVEIVQHEPITISNYDGTNIQILGVYSDLFEVQASEGAVVVQVVTSVYFPEDVSYVGLELRAGTTGAALVLDVTQSEELSPPTVSFESASYQLSVVVTQTGLAGRFHAQATNGERLVYSLIIDNEHLRERVSIDSEGALYLSAPANIGVYQFMVAATTVASQVSATADARMSVEAVTVCGTDDLVVPPLIVLDRDEEEPHEDLVVLNGTQGCRYELTDRWPPNQEWLYVDDRGLHTRAIDREDDAISLMALSQIQVELNLYCDVDEIRRNKRSTDAIRPDWLGPYEYGDNNWILTETILYNSRKTLVNLIVNDINDNYPIFENKENEPIAVGYPVSHLLDFIEPGALIQLKANDADIGENAHVIYWSSAPEVAVAPNTGKVHIRDNQRDLAEGTLITVHATDRAGTGLTGDVNLVVRILDEQHIAIITIRNAFLEDEDAILSDLSNTLGYEIKSLKSVVVSDKYDDSIEATRTKRQATEPGGASLKIFVYGLFQRDPVEVGQLTSDINNNIIVSVSVADIISLQDYLQENQICVITETGRDTGLLVATIVLSVLLFILILLIALWAILKWRKGMKYEEFSDTNSLASRIDSTNSIPESALRPKLNIDEIKRSERRLQEMLDAPVRVKDDPSTSTQTILDIPPPDATIVIQSIDKLKNANEDSDEDEFGERKRSKARRKSVVTFNENVEKIIHVEDSPYDQDSPELEVYKL